MAQIFPIDFDEKLTIANGDYILFSDSEDGNKIKKAQYSNLKGEQGDPGTPGADGSAATITVGSVSTLPAGSSATVTNSGTSSAAVLNFGIPEGATGAAGADGQDGNDGAAATITVGTTTTLPAGSSATVTNVGTSQDAILNFGIPKGDSGTGSGDVNGPASSTDGHLAVFDGATGKIIKDGGAKPTKVSDLSNDSGYLTSSTGVTSVNGQTGTVTVETPNIKTFYLSSTSDLTTAQAAYDWYADGKNPIVVLSNTAYMIKYVDIEKLRFGPTSFHSNLISNSTTSVTQDILDINFSAGVVSSITTSNSGLTGNFLRTDYNYSSPYTPAYDGSPATKKYVDDKQSTISVTLTSAGWSSNAQTVSATGVTASNTVIVSPDPSSFSNYTNAKIYCSAQATDSLTFACSTQPSNDITVNVVILD